MNLELSSSLSEARKSSSEKKMHFEAEVDKSKALLRLKSDQIGWANECFTLVQIQMSSSGKLVEDAEQLRLQQDRHSKAGPPQQHVCCFF